MNTITVQGNLVKAPKLIYSEKGTAILNFVLADNGYANGEKTVVYWDCFMYGEPAQRLGEDYTIGRQYVVKGMVVPNNYEKNGVKVYGVRMFVECYQKGLKPKEKK